MRALLVVSMVLVSGRAAADPAAVRKVLEEHRVRLHIAGLAYAVVLDDKVVALEGLGQRDLARQLPVTPDTVFPIGSCTKAFTAMAVAIASDDGKLSLDDSPHRHLRGLKLRDAEANELVTLRDMLSHRTGLKAYADLAAQPNVLTREQYLRAAISAKPVARLRESFQYSNAMITAAAEVVARTYHQSWERVIETKILAPLGMKRTRTSSFHLRGDAAVGYAWDGTTWTPTAVTPSLTAMAPAGSIASTARDLTRWLRVLANGGVLDGKRLVSAAMMRELTTPHTVINPTLSYALGWAVYDVGGHRVVEHNGGSAGLSALVSFMPDRRAGFIVLANSSPTELTQIGKLGARLWPLILDERATTPAPTAPSRTAAPAVPKLTTRDLPKLDELLARMVAAAGGERNLRAHTSMRLRATGAYEHQGVTFSLTIEATSTARAEDERWTASGVRIGRVRTFFDGTHGGQQTTFGQDETVTDLRKARREAALHPLLELHTLYDAVTLAGKTQLDDEDVYVLALGTDTKLYVSARTALVVRRDRGAETTRFSDFRIVEGEVVPFMWTTHDALGEKTVEVQTVSWNVALPASTFKRPAKLVR